MGIPEIESSLSVPDSAFALRSSVFWLFVHEWTQPHCVVDLVWKLTPHPILRGVCLLTLVRERASRSFSNIQLLFSNKAR